jgi:hypothetical protein
MNEVLFVIGQVFTRAVVQKVLFVWIFTQRSNKILRSFGVTYCPIFIVNGFPLNFPHIDTFSSTPSLQRPHETTKYMAMEPVLSCNIGNFAH